MLRKYCAALQALLLMFFFAASQCIAAEPSLHCEAAVLMDAFSGRILYEKRADFKRPIASITKIMTAIVTIESGRLNEIVTVSPRAARIGGSTLGLRSGERISVRDLLYALMLRSANDAAVALAEHLAGDVQTFADLMTRKAREIGAINTQFSNPHGLDQPEHFSTAHDIALIARYALRNNLFSAIVRTKTVKISRAGGSYEQQINNINKFLNTYPTAVGIKTGYTSGAGRCLVGAAENNGRTLIAVVLNSSQRYRDCTSLMDYGFGEFDWEIVLDEQQKVADLRVNKGRHGSVGLYPTKSIVLPLREEERGLVSIQINSPGHVSAPIAHRQVVGTVELFIGEIRVLSVPLAVKQQVERKTTWDFFKQSWNGWLIK